MSLTITEKIIRNHCEQKNLTTGDFALVNVDRCLANDITAPKAIEVFEKVIEESGKFVLDQNKIILTPDFLLQTKILHLLNKIKYSENLLKSIS